MKKDDWVYCPICNSKTRLKITRFTEAKNLPVFCPKCKNSFVADIGPGFKIDIKLHNN